MWIIHEPKKVALWNKRHFEEKNRECAACLKYSVLIFVEKNIYIKCNIWRVAVCLSYIKDARFLKVKRCYKYTKPEINSWFCNFRWLQYEVSHIKILNWLWNMTDEINELIYFVIFRFCLLYEIRTLVYKNPKWVV